MNAMIKVDLNENQEPIVSGRELHEVLEIKTDYKKWFDRMSEYGFSENVDFCTVSQKCPAVNAFINKLDFRSKLSKRYNIAGKLA